MNKSIYTLISTFLCLFLLEPKAQTIVRGPYLQAVCQENITIRWRTDNATTSKVWFGNSASSLNSYEESGIPTTEHEVLLSGLSSNTTYYYAIGNANGQMAGGDSEHYFKTSPVPGSSEAMKIWVLGDAGKKNSNQRSVRDAFYAYNGNEPVDLILTLGDNAYSDGKDSEFQDAWFENMYEDRLINIPVFMTYGNHEGGASDAVDQTGPFFDIFNHPTNGECGGVPSGNESFYSFDYGNVHFIALNTWQVDHDPDSEMIQWLIDDLAANTQDWTVVTYHHPPYDGRYGIDSDNKSLNIAMRENTAPIFDEYGVDLVMTGHSHSYQRSFLIDGHYGMSNTFDPATMGINTGDGQLDGDGAYQKVDGKGVVYMVAGVSGSVNSGENPMHPVMYHNNVTLGSLILSIDHDQLDVEFLTADGIIDDYFTIQKDLGPDGTISIANPIHGYPAPQNVIITTELLNPNNPVLSVDFVINNTVIGTDNSFPFNMPWMIPANGEYDVEIVATTNLGETTDSVHIVVGSKMVCQAISASSDDAEQNGGGLMSLTNPSLNMVAPNALDQRKIGLRFTEMNIPQGAIINSAFLEFTAYDNTNIDPCDLNIQGFAHDDVSTFINTGYELDNRTTTTVSINWSPGQWVTNTSGGIEQTVDLSAVVQEIVNRSSFTETSAIGFFISGAGQRNAFSFDGNVDAAPKLCIEYTVPYPPDSDGDGTPDSEDLCNGSLEPGALCDDSNPTTHSDAINNNCICEGTPFDCLDLLVDFGTTCDDGDQYTTNDMINGDCQCAGVLLPPTTTISTKVNIGSDDAEEEENGDVNLTSSDLELVRESDDQKIGIRFTNANIPPNVAILEAYIHFTVDETSNQNPSVLEIYGEANANPSTFIDVNNNISNRPKTNASVIWEPSDWTTEGAKGAAQKTVDLTTVVQELVSHAGYTSNSALVFLIEGTGKRVAVSFNGDSQSAVELVVTYETYSSPYDCPQLQLNFGDSCDDGNANTSNDIITSDCQCLGTLAYDCPQLQLNFGDTCDDGDANTSNDAITSDCQCLGTTVFDCPQLQTNFGDSCDDNNPNTNNDVVTSDCACLGALAYDCPQVQLNFGDTCDDGNANTSNDVITSDCECAGTAITFDCPNLQANIGDACDDSDPNTISGQVTAFCLCEGEVVTGYSVTVSIISKSDDAEEKPNGSVKTTSSDLEMTKDGGSVQKVGLRFQDVGIPLGAIIQSTYIQFTSEDDENSDPCILTIYGEANDNAPTFQAANNNISNRQRTDAFAIWTPVEEWGTGDVGAAQMTADLSSLVQEIIDRPGYEYNNPIVFLIEGTGNRVAESYDGNPNASAKLIVNYNYTFIDDDNDGVSNAQDACPNTPGVPGTPCDDNDSETFNDVIDDNCDCIGIPPLGFGCAQIASSNDDAEEKGSGKVRLTSTDLELANDGSDQAVGLRFLNLQIPPGVTISSADIQFTVDELKNNDPCNLTIYGELHENPGAFTSLNFNISSRNKTNTYFTWMPDEWTSVNDAGTSQQTVDIAPIIQEIVSQPGYDINSAIVIIIEGEGTRTAESFDGEATKAAELCIDYDAGTTFTSAVPHSEEEESKRVVTDLSLSSLHIFPNPAKDHITLRFDSHIQDKEATVQIWDGNGRLVHHEKRMIVAGDNELLLENLSLVNGTYTIQLFRDPFLKAAKFVIYN